MLVSMQKQVEYIVAVFYSLAYEIRVLLHVSVYDKIFSVASIQTLNKLCATLHLKVLYL